MNNWLKIGILQLLWLSLLLLCGVQAVQAARDIRAEISEVRIEKMRLAKVRQKLESQLGMLGRTLQSLDKKLHKARAKSKLAQRLFDEADKKVKVLESQQQVLQRKVEKLQQSMQQEASAAWMQANRVPGWPDILAGVPITEIPHRKHMMKVLLEHQTQAQQAWLAALAELDGVQKKLLVQREIQAKRLSAKKKSEQILRQQQIEKRKLVKKVKHDVSLQKQRQKELDKQEKALQRLLKGLQNDLLATEKTTEHMSIRKQKGKLPWPLRGKIVASYGSKAKFQRSRLRGVQLAPMSKSKTARQVRAIADGQVRYADWFGGFGLMLIIEHGDGVMSIYAHNDALYKQVGDWVEKREVLADAGSTGWVDTTRLYFEIRVKGKPSNPVKWCSK